MNQEKIEFDSERRWTIIGSWTDEDTREAFVRNWGITETSLAKLTNLKSNGFEKDISTNELKTLLNNVYGNFVIEGVFEIENHYNTDMTTINELKRNIEARLKNKGYTIIEHCEAVPTLREDAGKVFESRGYLKLVKDLYDMYEGRYKKYEEDIKKQEAVKEALKKDIIELEDNKRMIEAFIDEKIDIQAMRDTYVKGREYLKRQEKDISEAKKQKEALEEENERLNGLIERQKKDLERGNIHLDDMKTKIEMMDSRYNDIINKVNKMIKLYKQTT